MITYLLKVTLIWAILLLLYELLYRRSSAFTMNRIYLFVALAAGLVLPLLTWILPWVSRSMPDIAAASLRIQGMEVLNANAAQPEAPEQAKVSWFQLLIWVYLAGAAGMAFVSLREVILILRKAVYGQYKTIAGHRIFSNAHQHAPFSFMGWIFISDPEQYSTTELAYILRHEDAHNRRKHWLDVLLMQLAFIIFWFHPLVWRFRYLLKLTHEYEADRIAADTETYAYGHFLLQQILLKGTPAIAHSFHFSPIKNRITMLTTKRKTNIRKFAVVLPVLLACTVLFAKTTANDQRIRIGDVTTFRGHHFRWEPQMVDSVSIEDPVTNEVKWMVMHKEGRIFRLDQDSVYYNENPSITEAQFRYNKQNFYEYVGTAFKKTYNRFPDSIQSIGVKNIVVDGNGKLRYYELWGYTDRNNYDMSLPGSPFEPYGKLLAKIIDESPDWLPAIAAGKNVAVSFQGGFNVYFKPMKGRLVTPASPKTK